LHGTLAEAALHVGDIVLARHEARAALRSADAAWYARDAARTRLLSARIVARADALDGNYDAARRAADALDGDDPLVAADRAIFAGMAHEPDAAARREHARRAIAAAMPIDAADAVWLSSAAELLDVFGGGAPVKLRYVPFDALIARRAEIGGRSFETQLIERLGAPLLAGHTSAPVALPVEALTAREAEILALLASGLTNREIAQRLVLSARTVETHVARVTGKLGVNSRARAVARAVTLGLVTPSETAV